MSAQGRRERFAATFSVATELVERCRVELMDDIITLSDLVLETLRAGGKILLCGNGGSAADAQHLAAEYVVRFESERASLPAIALTTDTSILTAGANDLGFDEIFARQVRGLARAGDLLIGLSTSGESENVIRAARAARDMGAHTAALTARGGGRLRDEVDHVIVVPTSSTARGQEMHILIGHMVCDAVDHWWREENGMSELVQLLREGRRRERAQAAFYRTLAGMADEADDVAAAERLNGLLADEQHHVSRLSARLLELGEALESGRVAPGSVPPLDDWEDTARTREADEIAWYEAAARIVRDEATVTIIEEILLSERHHHEELGGKWMPAEPPGESDLS